jgi:hypothetical protein
MALIIIIAGVERADYCVLYLDFWLRFCDQFRDKLAFKCGKDFSALIVQGAHWVIKLAKINSTFSLRKLRVYRK